MRTVKGERQNVQSEDEALELSQEEKALRAFNAGYIDLKGFVAPDPIDRYEIDQFDNGVGFAGFLIEQTVNSITNSARWALRQLRR